MTQRAEIEGSVERPCGECKGSGIAEHIAHMARPCDACHGEGVLKVTTMEAALLDQCEAQFKREVADVREIIAAYFDHEDFDYSPDQIRAGEADHCIDAALNPKTEDK